MFGAQMAWRYFGFNYIDTLYDTCKWYINYI